jgi:hypothetical protein
MRAGLAHSPIELPRLRVRVVGARYNRKLGVSSAQAGDPKPPMTTPTTTLPHSRNHSSPLEPLRIVRRNTQRGKWSPRTGLTLRASW